jgi:environmental stress-induced protein Ves
MPWRNGGGMTTELAIEPSDASVDGRFLYRVSVADVATSGPFSRFVGYERHIVLIDGAGMHLDCGAHGTLDLVQGVPHTFSGDWDVRGELRSGPVRDFNVMVHRTRASSSFDVRTLGTNRPLECPSGATLIVHWLDGELTGETWIVDSTTAIDHPDARAAVAQILIIRGDRG